MFNSLKVRDMLSLRGKDSEIVCSQKQDFSKEKSDDFSSEVHWVELYLKYLQK